MPVRFSQSTQVIAGCRIALRRGGSGPSLLYLHGAGGAAEIEPFLHELARDHEVLVPEHPGFGASDEPAWLDNIHDLAYFYLDFLEQLDLHDLVLVGSSLGGWAALEIAVRQSSRLRALSLVAPAGLYVPGLKRGDVFLWTPEERVRNLVHDPALAERLLAQPPGPAAADAALKNLHTFARLAWEPRLFDPHLAKWLHRIRVPVQLVWGESDKVIPAGYAAEFKRLIPQARVDLIPACGHVPPVEKPAEFVRLLRSFLVS